MAPYNITARNNISWYWAKYIGYGVLKRKLGIYGRAVVGGIVDVAWVFPTMFRGMACITVSGAPIFKKNKYNGKTNN